MVGLVQNVENEFISPNKKEKGNVMPGNVWASIQLRNKKKQTNKQTKTRLFLSGLTAGVDRDTVTEQ